MRSPGRSPSLALDDALRMLPSLDWTAPDRRPGVIAYLPSFFGNPYQSLLYSELHQAGFQAAPMYYPDKATAFAEQVTGGDLRLVVHAHWLNGVTSKAQDEIEAREAAKAYLEQLERAKDLGARVLWTVHNILPHDSVFEEVDTELRRDMANLADRVHVMTPRTPELVAPWFDIAEDKMFVVPHPGYHGIYPSWMRRAQARAHLGIGPETIVFLMIGAVKPYKGITELLDAFDELSRREPGRYVLLVAGKPDHDPETVRFIERALVHPAVFLAPGMIPDDQMQLYLRAADIGVYPYRRSLNSGALALGLTFGLPAVLPTHSGATAGTDPSYVELYDATEPDGLLEALANASRLVSEQARAAASAAIERFAPGIVGRAFAEAVRTWVDEAGD